MFATKIEQMKREEGFTLIELLVVVIIIGILAAIAIPTFLNQRQRGWQAELTSDVRNTALDIEAQATALSGNPPAEVAGNALPANITAPGTNTGYHYAVHATNDSWCLSGERLSTASGELVGVIEYHSGQGLSDFLVGQTTLACTPGTMRTN